MKGSSVLVQDAPHSRSLLDRVHHSIVHTFKYLSTQRDSAHDTLRSVLSLKSCVWLHAHLCYTRTVTQPPNIVPYIIAHPQHSLHLRMALHGQSNRHMDCRAQMLRSRNVGLSEKDPKVVRGVWGHALTLPIRIRHCDACRAPRKSTTKG